MQTDKRELVEHRAAEMLQDLIGNDYSDTTLRVATDWLKQERRLALKEPLLPGREALPDIGAVHPLQMDHEERAERDDRLRAAFSVQQKGIPDQTALVWRTDLIDWWSELVRSRARLALIPAQPRTEQGEALEALKAVAAAMLNGGDGETGDYGWSITKLNKARPLIRAALANGGERIPVHGRGEVRSTPAEQERAIAIGRELDAEDGGYPLPLSTPDHDCRDQVGTLEINMILAKHFSRFIPDVIERIQVGNAACAEILATLSPSTDQGAKQ